MAEAKVLFYRASNGGVACKLSLGAQLGYQYHAGRGREVRHNRDDDRAEYPFIVSYGYLNAFLSANGVKDTDVLVDARSLDRFYGFERGERMEYSVNLTESFADRWWGADAPHIYRYAVNKDRHRNDFGLQLICFSNLLVEASFQGTYIDDTITEDEVARLGKDREQTGIYQDMQNALAARKLDAADIDQLKTDVRDYEQKVQAVINVHAADILKIVEGMDANAFGLDSGSLHIFTRNQAITDKKAMLKNTPGIEYPFSAAWLHLSLPRESQSTTILREEFAVIQAAVKQDLGEDIYCTTPLD